MAGITGIARPGMQNDIKRQLGVIHHRGTGSKSFIREHAGTTVGAIPAASQPVPEISETGAAVVLDGFIYNWDHLAPDAPDVYSALHNLHKSKGPDFTSELDGPFAFAIPTEDSFYIARDTIGVAPLYYGARDGALCFASEAKALLGWAEVVKEFPPGCYYTPKTGLHTFSRIKLVGDDEMDASSAASDLYSLLSESVAKCIEASKGETGSWLSGGLDSSAIAAVAGKQVPKLKTFAVGLAGAPDLRHAQEVADFIGSDHQEIVITLEDMLKYLPEVIYHLESFDALLIRSSIMNYIAGKVASNEVAAVFSGEGGDELFAGYDYLKDLPVNRLPGELVDITNRLHNTALQRVDRCSAAHGLTTHTAFLDMQIVEYALRIPSEYKIRRNGTAVEKWILRKAVDGLLPDSVLNRPKAKFWEGSGVTDILEQYVSHLITDEEFNEKRRLQDGSLLNTKEEYFYYQLFCDYFGRNTDISFVGRTKGAPIRHYT